MEPTTFQPWMILSILPEIGLILLAALILVLDLLWRGPARRNLAWVTAGGLVIIIGLAIVFARPQPEPVLIFGGMLRLDGTAFVFRLIFLAGAALTAMFMIGHEPEGRDGEFYALLLAAAFGMNLMAASADLIMLYLALEPPSLPLYVMAGSMTRDPRSAEACTGSRPGFPRATSRWRRCWPARFWCWSGLASRFQRCRSISGRRMCMRALLPPWPGFSQRPLRRLGSPS